MESLNGGCTMDRSRQQTARTIVGALLFVSLTVSAAYAFFGFLHVRDAWLQKASPAQVRSHYLLLLVKCILCMVVMWLPRALARWWCLSIPDRLCAAYYAFLYGAVVLGDVFDFYHVVPQWDILLHALSGAMLCELGFLLMRQLSGEEHALLPKSPVLAAVFAFCFALAIGALWEIYEFIVDCILDLNMQKTRAPNGAAFVGAAALLDTMGDMIAGAFTAAAVALAGYRAYKKEVSAVGV
jgi:hypothetical protein